MKGVDPDALEDEEENEGEDADADAEEGEFLQQTQDLGYTKVLPFFACTMQASVFTKN